MHPVGLVRREEGSDSSQCPALEGPTRSSYRSPMEGAVSVKKLSSSLRIEAQTMTKTLRSAAKLLSTIATSAGNFSELVMR